jgi:hypothetical protein
MTSSQQSILFRVFAIALLLSIPTTTWGQGLNAETARLEATVLCQAMPWTCSQGAQPMLAQATPQDPLATAKAELRAMFAPKLEELCAELRASLRASLQQARPSGVLHAKEEHAWQTLVTDCGLRLAFPVALATPPPVASTVRCTTTNVNNMVRHPYDAEFVTTCTTD